MALVSGISLDPEAAIGVTKKLPPKWIDGVDEVNNFSCSLKMFILEMHINFFPVFQCDL